MECCSQFNVREGSRDCTLVIMAKAPKLGMVKTRLAPSLPPHAVTALYRCLLEDTIALAQSLGSVDVAIMCPASDVDDLTLLVDDALPVVAQMGQGLAAGLTSVFAHFSVAGHQRVIAFDSDSPHVPASVLESAFESLCTCDMVVGPTHDGGYYLVGATAAHPGIFNGNGMGTSSALETLVQRVRGLGLSLSFADSFYDIDVASNLIRLDTELRVCPARAPRTAAWLAKWGPVGAQSRSGIEKL